MLQAWTADFDYKLQRLSSARTEVFSPFFANLPLDPYIEGTFRRRRFSRFQGEPENLTRLEHKYFEQSSSVNKLAGGVKRDFAELEEDLVRLPEFQVLVSRFVDFSKIEPETTEIGIHQIRIVASPDQVGEPAPEGIHQDGFDFVGIFCISREHLVGAETHLCEHPSQAPIFAKELQPGEFVLVNDRKLYHFTTGIKPVGATEGTRDVFVMTA
ncbi:MAG TPA: 2OG-Fe dioxygenase family protein [Chthoniobacterales bacterium]|nr:2OG-Fe dioxygenase family protein [Chthoniobacterales bacterium]